MAAYDASPSTEVDCGVALTSSFFSGLEQLAREDAELYELAAEEHWRQLHTLSMVASSSAADPAVLACQAMTINNLTTEGYPGNRFHSGCEVIDKVEELAVHRSKLAFKAQCANVQPHSGTGANQIAMFGLLDAGDRILGMDLRSGGHLSHGARASYSGTYFDSIGYGVDAEGFIDYDAVRRLAKTHRPRMIVCGASAYPRTIDFRRFRQIADEVDALLLADISHIAGLVVTAEHPSPIDHAHVITTSMYKQLCGPRGGLILLGRDHSLPNPRGKGTLADAIQASVFPFFQGTPNPGAITAKARALRCVTAPQFKHLCRRIVDNAAEIAAGLAALGYGILTGGTDNHMVIVSLKDQQMTGWVAQSALEECGMLINRNLISGDRRPASICSGIRIGTNVLAQRGMARAEMRRCVELMDRVIHSTKVLGDTQYELNPTVRSAVRAEVAALCDAFPLAGYGH